MSGGAYEYAYHRIDELAGDIAARSESPVPSEARRAFVAHLIQVASVARALEWADSGDTDGSEAELMIEQLVGRAKVEESAAAEVTKACEAMRKLLERVGPTK